MAFGTFSAIFNAWVYNSLYRTVSFNGALSSTGYKAALYGNTGTPDNTDTAAHTAYNGVGGAWVVANEVTDATNWVAGGRPIAPTGSGAAATPPTVYVAQNYVELDGLDTAGGGNVTLANVFGDLVYDTSATLVVNQAVAYHAFGGAQGVTAGTFTIIWNNPNGIARWTHTPA